MIEKAIIIFIYAFLPIAAFFCNVFLKLESAYDALRSPNAQDAQNVQYLVTDEQSAWLLFVFAIAISIIAILIKLFNRINQRVIFNKKVVFEHLILATGISLALSVVGILIADLIWMIANEQYAKYSFSNFSGYLANYFAEEWWLYLFLLIPLMLIALYRMHTRKSKFSEDKDTTGKFGSAAWANRGDLEKINAYNEANEANEENEEDEGNNKNSILIGLDEKGKELYLPLTNKLTISPPGGGKTVASSIPILLSYNGPVFVFDIKGELWATTARYRAKTLGRQVVVIDPYGVTRTGDFAKDKPNELCVEYRINPFDFVPGDVKHRDRMINAFASSFVITQDGGGSSRHFDENAMILIRGYIDHMMKSYDPKDRTLANLYKLLSEDAKQANTTFNDMSGLAGRAAAASNQIRRVGINERGSILSTSYRQIDWMSDSNMQWAMGTSDFDLRDFIKGNMDIFVVLPEDQVKEHSRLVRMLMTLLMSIIIQANPSDLPKNKMLFLLEELAQLGYCPDVEQCIEVLRARGVVVWTVFQSLSQIELFQKPDLFKGVTLKQIFTLDDVPTMQWIQALGGKKTVVNQTLSNNKGDSHQVMNTFGGFGGTVSHGISKSVQETAADLIQINEIREMSADEQYIFLHGQKPIKCKKVRYFEHPFFAGKYDLNPLESRSGQ